MWAFWWAFCYASLTKASFHKYHLVFIVAVLKLKQCDSSKFFFIKIILAILVLLSFHINFRVSFMVLEIYRILFVRFEPQQEVLLTLLCMAIVSPSPMIKILVEENWHKMILNLLIHEYSMSLHLFRPLISFNSIYSFQYTDSV